MNLKDLAYSYPEELIAKEPINFSRVMWVEKNEPSEVSIKDVIERIPTGDAFVINNTRVLKRRVFSEEGFEILFVEEVNDLQWKVLFPASRLKKNQTLKLPEGVELKLLESGLPQIVEVSKKLTQKYFESFGEFPLPPYIQKARDDRHNYLQDEEWYQTDWAKKAGSYAAPTASLHFNNEDMNFLRKKGVTVLEITLHVGLGTFLPVKVDNLDQHKMHAESAYVPGDVYQKILEIKKNGNHIWGLGTTVARTLESIAQNKLLPNKDGDYEGETDLFIYPPYEYKIVDRLLTNFHQPESTLLALVAAFSTLENVKKCYSWALERKFRLFSYGDLSVWIK